MSDNDHINTTTKDGETKKRNTDSPSPRRVGTPEDPVEEAHAESMDADE